MHEHVIGDKKNGDRKWQCVGGICGVWHLEQETPAVGVGLSAVLFSIAQSFTSFFVLFCIFFIVSIFSFKIKFYTYLFIEGEGTNTSQLV